jgi:DNA end-binding protein Ku
MAIRSIASLSLSFGLVSIPVKLYSATESAAAIRFKLMAPSGARVRQHYVSVAPPPAVEERRPEQSAPAPEPPEAKVRGAAFKVIDFPTNRHGVSPPRYQSPATPDESVVERSAMLKGYEYQKGKFVLFTPEELKALEAGSRKSIDIVSFIPESAIDPIYYDKAYFLAPDRGGAKPYNLLVRAMGDTGRCALAKWAFRSKEYVAQIRPGGGGMVLQQLFYAEEVRSFAGLQIEPTDIGEAELKLAKQLIDQISADSYDPSRFVDEEKKRILAAVEEKLAGKQLPAAPVPTTHGPVVNLLDALRASLRVKQGTAPSPDASTDCQGERKPPRRVSRKRATAPVRPKTRQSKS